MRRTERFVLARWLLVAVLLVLAFAALIPAALATSPRPDAERWYESPIPLGENESRNWAGYAAFSGSFTAVSGTWKVPSVAASSTLASTATWVGIGGISSTDLIQAGTQATTISSGPVQYSAWIEALPAASQTVSLTISPGDTISVSVAQQSAHSWLITLTDATTKQTVRQNVPYTSSLSSAEWIVERPSTGRRLVPLANFGTIQISNGTTVKNGTRITMSRAEASSIDMVGRRAQIIASPSDLGSDGASFTVTWSGNASPPTFPFTPIRPNAVPVPWGWNGVTPWSGPPWWRFYGRRLVDVRGN